MQSYSACRRRHRRSTTAIAAVVALALSTVAVPAAAAQAPRVPDEVRSEQAASAAAKAGNKQVRVLDKTDEVTDVVANPDGTFTWTQHVRPVRVRRGDSWAPIDTTLVKRPDGSIGPKSAIVDLTLSGGGSGSLVTIAGNGVETGLSWPHDLPAPRLDGDTATYPEVLPGVDLRITAGELGYRQVLVVKTPQAAADPGLKRITFGSHTKGGEIAEQEGKGAGRYPDRPEQGDGVTVTDPSGKQALTGDASAMWDSTAEKAPELKGTGLGARTATMDVEVAPDSITVIPDQDFLTSPKTTYPVYLDPEYNCTSCGKAHHVVVQSAWPNAYNFDRTGGTFDDLKAGYVCEGTCTVSRTYLRMNTGSLGGKYIADAYLHLDTLHSYYCAGATPTQLYLSNWVDGNTTWNNQPALSSGLLSTGNTVKNANHCAGNPGGMDLGATSAIASAAAGYWGETTFLVRGQEEGNNTSWRRFDLNPYLVVKYNSYPNKPVDLGIEGWGPNAGDALQCGAFVGTRTPRLRARLSDPDGGVLNAVFRGAGSDVGVGNIPSGTYAEVQVSVPNDGAYTWRVAVGDGSLLGPESDNCAMTVDTVAPGVPVVASAEYPSGRDAGGVGKSGTFTFSAPNGTSDIAYYLYSFTNQGDDPQTRVTPATLNGKGTAYWTPMMSGPQILSVRAVDRAGNRSEINRYRVDVADYQVGVSGKVAQWSFDGGLTDTSGAKSLNYVGPPPPGGIFGPGPTGQGQAAIFDSVERKEYQQAKDSLIRTDRSFTVSAWARLDSDAKYHTILSQDGVHASGFKLQYNDYYDRWAISLTDADVDNPATIHKALSANPPALGVWTHLTGVYDASTGKLQLYVNGTLEGTTTLPTTPWNATGPFVVGAAKVNGERSHHFLGAIDSVRVHARALAPSEITALASSGAGANPVAEYRYENNLANTGATNDLSMSPGTPNYGPGFAEQALRLDRAQTARPSTAQPVVDTTGAFSAAAWVRLDDKNGYYTLFSQDGNRLSGFMVRYSVDVDRWIFGAATTDADTATHNWAIGTESPKAGVWTHIAAVQDNATHKISLYVNGVLNAQSDQPTTFAATGPFVIGAGKAGGARTDHLVGKLDHVNVYDGALTADEVATLYNTPVQLGRYALDETSGAVAANTVPNGAPGTVHRATWGQAGGKPAAQFNGLWTNGPGATRGGGLWGGWTFNNAVTDYSGNGRDLTFRNASGPTTPVYDTGHNGPAIKLNGTDQHLARTGPMIDTAKSYSVSAWVRLDRDNGWFSAVAQEGTNSSPFSLMYSDADDRWSFTTSTQDSAPVVARANSTAPPRLNQWTHLLGVHDAQAGKIRLYVNGYLESETAFTSPWKSTGEFVVGRLRWGGAPADFFPGSIDEVQVYDRVLDAGDAHDLWDLSSDISVPQGDTLRADQSLTISAWVRPDSYDGVVRQAFSLGAAGRYSPIAVGYRPEWKRWGLLAETTGSNLTPKWLISDNEAATYADQDGWVHLTAVYDSARRQAKLYVNGIPQGTVPIDGTRFEKSNPSAPYGHYAGADLKLADTGRDLLIGRMTWEGIPNNPWKGSIRDVRVFTGVVPDSCDASPVCVSQLRS